ncbi:MAG: 8-amino-7-oxononanoate synthase [Desulfuromonadales bacterium]|nr:8-amino-7-oxononanoate synthase [Desulfuromonadales bacterium]
MQEWHRQLEELAQQGMKRTLRTIESAQGPWVQVAGRDLLLLCSNNYLGLASHPALVEAAGAAMERYGFGTGGSRLISGSMRAHRRLEEALAAFKGVDAALLFNSGYAANTGLLPALFGPGDLIFSDALNHASLVDGCRLSRARTIVYPHADVAALEALMAAQAPQRQGRWLILTDGVFSMDGDLAPLPDLVRLKHQYDALLMVDDAHGTGVLGATGRGTGEHFGCLDAIDLHMGTLSKAMGGFGAFVAAGQPLIDLLVNRGRSFIFSTSLPPAVAAAGLAALELLQGEEGERRRQELWRNREAFAAILHAAGLDLLGSVTPIIPVLTGEPGPTMALTDRLLDKGIFVQGIRPPTVPTGRCRLRATLMADHREPEVKYAAEQMVAALAEAQ